MSKPTQCFLDMDGVIVDLHTTVYERCGIQPDEIDRMVLWNNGQLDMTPEELWTGTDAEWWATLDWTTDGRELLDYLEETFGRDNIHICTKPAPWEGSCDGKLLWIERNIPSYARRYILTQDKSACASPRTLLIDDSEKNVDTFRMAGGKSVLVPRPWNRDGNMAEFSLDYTISLITGEFYD